MWRRLKLMGLIAAGATAVSGCASTFYDPYTGELYSTYGVGVYGTYPYGTYSYPYGYSTPYAYGLPLPYSPYPPFGPTIPPW